MPITRQLELYQPFHLPDLCWNLAPVVFNLQYLQCCLQDFALSKQEVEDKDHLPSCVYPFPGQSYSSVCFLYWFWGYHPWMYQHRSSCHHLPSGEGWGNGLITMLPTIHWVELTALISYNVNAIFVSDLQDKDWMLSHIKGPRCLYFKYLMLCVYCLFFILVYCMPHLPQIFYWWFLQIY